MPSPPDVRHDNIVDAAVLAGAGSEIDRTYTGAELARLSEAGAAKSSSVSAHLSFSEFDGRPVITGRVSGTIVLTCQRCMSLLSNPLDESFRVLVVDEELADEPGGYEPVLANPNRFDLRWLVEDQVLLALPLVPMHAEDDCDEQQRLQQAQSEINDADAGQKPFQNLRDMMRKR